MSDSQTRRFFFFPHGLEKHLNDAPKAFKAGQTPWRVQLAVRGTRVSRDGVSQAEGIVMGDGFYRRGGSPITGGNQDPCIFSAPFHGVHAYIRAGVRKGNDNDVVLLGGGPSGKLLTQLARPGDVVIYGKPDLDKETVAVDTVIVVGESIEFPEAMARAPEGTDARNFSLSDSRPLGSHQGEDKHHILVGASAPTWEAVHSLSASFVPLAEKSREGQWVVLRVKVSDPAAHRTLFTLFREIMFTGKGALAGKGRICELPPAEAEQLVRATIATSGASNGVPGSVFVLPVTPRGRLDRLGSDGHVRTHEDHMNWIGV